MINILFLSLFFGFLNIGAADCDDFLISQFNAQRARYKIIDEKLTSVLEWEKKLSAELLSNISTVASLEEELLDWYDIHKKSSGVLGENAQKAVQEKEKAKLTCCAHLAKVTKKILLCSGLEELEAILKSNFFDKSYMNDWLMLAADSGRYKALSPLIEAGADVSHVDSDGNTIFDLLLKNPYKKSHIPSFDKKSLNSWLLIAAQMGKYNALSSLILYGADALSKDSNGNTIFHFIGQNSYDQRIPHKILCLLIIDADILNSKNQNGHTPLTLMEQVRREKNWKRYLLSLPMTHCLPKTYLHTKYSLLQYLLKSENEEITESIKYAIEDVLPFSNPYYRSDGGRTYVDFADHRTEIGEKVINNAWEKLVLKDKVISVGERKIGPARKQKLMLEYLHSNN